MSVPQVSGLLQDKCQQSMISWEGTAEIQVDSYKLILTTAPTKKKETLF